MRKVTLLLMTLVAVTRVAVGQVDVGAINRPIELLNEANADIENGDYKDAVQKLIAANRLNPKLREVYSSLNTACTHTNQISLLKEFLVKGKGIFEEDDELCYYLGNIYQNQQNYTAAIKEYSLAIQYAKKNGEEYELVYAYYLNRGNCYLKQREFAKAIPDYTYSLKLNKDNGAILRESGNCLFQYRKAQGGVCRLAES